MQPSRRRDPFARFRAFFRARRGLLLRLALIMTAVLALTLSLLTVLRSIHTRQRNETYTAWREEALEENAEKSGGPVMAWTGIPEGGASALSALSASDSAASSGDSLPDESGVFHRASGEILPEMQELRRRNRDLTAWLTIGNVLDLPVVFRDNETYLTRDFEGNKNPSGTLFLDESHPLTERTQTLLIHGHNMKDGSMFGMLPRYKDKSFCEQHQLIWLTTLWDRELYMVFAVAETSLDPAAPDYIDYFRRPVFPDDLTFEAFIRQLRSRAAVSLNLKVGPSDALLLLSTCIGERRLIVAARRL